MVTIRLILILTISLLGTITIFGQDTKITTLTFYTSSLKMENELYFSINITNEDGWHTYWQNPGDAGTPLEFIFENENGETIPLIAMQWPTPIRYMQDGDMWGYGYAGKYSLFFKIPPEILSKIKNKTITVKGSWLACSNICIPGQQEEPLQIDENGSIVKTQSNSNSVDHDASVIEKRLNDLPKEATLSPNLDLSLAQDSSRPNGLLLYYTISETSEEALFENINVLTPFPHPPFTFKHEFLYRDKNNNIYGKLLMDWDGVYMEPEMPMPLDGKFATPYKLKFLFANPLSHKVEIIEKEFTQFELNADGRLANLFSVLTEIKTNVDTSQAQNENDMVADQPNNSFETIEQTTTASSESLWFYLLLAFAGGLLLNVMPCVLPIISLKLFSLLKSSEKEKSAILKHNFFYTLGILFSFLVLAIILSFLKMSTEGIGWGFQLQSPLFIIIMIEILFIFTLNLFGLFEFSTPGGDSLGNLKVSTGHFGDFANGILATILATPCSAPFLGVALTFAFASDTLTLFLVFLLIGLGLAFPFIVTGIFPALIKMLPRPGMWMEHLKKFLALSLILTIIWLFDVLIAQVDSFFVIAQLNLLLTFTFFAFYLRNQMSKKLLWQTLFFLIPLLLFVSITYSSFNEEEKEKIIWIPWSEEKMETLKKDHRPVLIDFTAKWCFTCKVNEKLVLETEAFQELVQKYDLELLLGDWTKKDPLIGAWLKAHGKVGVPAYFIQKTTGELVSLDETISITEIEKNLEE